MNLKQISNALQLYANDNEDYYPDQLSKLEPDYYKVLPLCPAVNLDTYSAGYEVEAGFRNYTQFCKGKNHEEMGLDEDEPYWNLSEGIMPK